MIEATSIESGGRALHVHWRDGGASRLPAIWLRDNAQDEASRHPGNGQRLGTILDSPPDLHIASARLGEGKLDVTFSPDGYVTRFDAIWLDRVLRRPVRRDHVLWDSAHAIFTAAWTDVRASDVALFHWLAAIARDGVAMLDGVPCVSGALAEVVARFGYIRETNYGRWFDVRAEIAPTNLAYTGLGLQVHTDNPYRDPVPGLQLLHCLANSAEGGDSVIVDGFKAAHRLREEDPAAYAILTRTAVPFRYDGSDTVLEAHAPLIGLDLDGEVVEIRFNNRSLGTPRLAEGDIEAWYAAYARFAGLLASPELQIVFKLSPGQLFMVDNRRVLHGRVGFSGSGSRHLQGAYADRDGLLSRLAVLRRRLGQGEFA